MPKMAIFRQKSVVLGIFMLKEPFIDSEAGQISIYGGVALVGYDRRNPPGHVHHLQKNSFYWNIEKIFRQIKHEVVFDLSELEIY